MISIRLQMSVDRVFRHNVSEGICNDLFRGVCLPRNAPQEPGIMRGRIWLWSFTRIPIFTTSRAAQIEFFIPILRTSCCVSIRNSDFFQEKNVGRALRERPAHDGLRGSSSSRRTPPSYLVLCQLHSSTHSRWVARIKHARGPLGRCICLEMALLKVTIIVSTVPYLIRNKWLSFLFFSLALVI